VRHVDEAMRARFRGVGRCPWCGQWAYLQCAHVLARGMGGGRVLDVPINLVPLCARCHVDSHAGRRPLACDLLAVVGAREGLLQHEIERRVRYLARAPKEAEVCPDCGGAGSFKVEKSYGFKRYPCTPCRGAGVLLNGEPWQERRKFTWEV